MLHRRSGVDELSRRYRDLQGYAAARELDAEWDSHTSLAQIQEGSRELHRVHR